jgi:hypothetical protein
MATELTMTGNKKIKTIVHEFSKKFNYISLVFKKGNGHAIDVEKTISEVREKNGGELSIVGNLTVGSLEKRFMNHYGIKVEVVVKGKDGKVYNTGATANARTLAAENKAAKEEGCLSFVL